ncbi:eukaryotic aspartyl protease [Hirsutella rhossiliensis]|uniref:Eukaryotic aspartyl protease domain-containing protein n=1 Tax=Hirsutella rhossiliensis TaxID=111463 RepID=A0A9P8SKY3_9HYPO|nr:eukaryotic aspartyl protease domain-containing protein [Hirsutella rhossiliensis]KAH0964566.1 eukaryotic aspartyl protease domain-containing protein [Hirsutella rhossiliensis]
MRFPATAAAAAIAAAGAASALDPAPVALQASDWLGIDGNWSTVSFLLGSNSDLVNVLISTTLSEFWAVGAGGCAGKDAHCNNARGGIYNPNKSKHWSTMGLWQLGLQTFGYNDNGEYGLDTVNAYSPITNIAFGMSNVLMAAMNTSNPFLGFFGLGIQQGRFGDIVADSPITQAVKSFGWTPSYSYGYTAGAHYRNTVVSATLGGYDSARFVPHDTAFTLEQGESIPHTLVRGIQVAANNSGDQPDIWSSPVEILSDWNSSFTAMIDSSTPYLWLPEPVCTRFAEALNLTYNSTYELYTLSNELYRDYTSNNSLTFTFSLTSYDNHDNFGMPLEVPGLVNITLPLQAFVSLLEYPFARGAIKYGDPAVPYFTLRKSKNDTFVIGRTFLQESYLITKFDESLYSVHQALFPANPERDAKLVPIRQPSNSPYPPPPRPHQDEELTTAQMAGIAVGAVLLCTVIVVGCCYFRRRRRQSRKGKSKDDVDNHNDSASTLAPDSPNTPVSKIFSKIVCRKHSQSRRGAADTDKAGNMNDAGVVGNQAPLEAPDCQIYELSASAAPIELDAGSDRHSIGEMELATENPQDLSAYEVARRRMEMQLRGPVPAYSPPTDGTILQPEKAMPNPRLLDTSQATLQPFPTSPMRVFALEVPGRGQELGRSTRPTCGDESI